MTASTRSAVAVSGGKPLRSEDLAHSASTGAVVQLPFGALSATYSIKSRPVV